jgi:hypothetical protein
MNLFSVEVLLTILVVCGGVYVATHSIFGVIAVFLALSLCAYFLGVWLGVPLEFPVQFSFDLEQAPQASIGIGLDWVHHPASTSEVFYIAGNEYTYKDAPNVCAVYDAQLASYDQLLEAYSKGAEWCGYGWTQGGMAMYPTQEKTWKALQQDVDSRKKTSCGRPGINGGYFDLNTKFGVNCYGVKPACDNRKYPISVGSSTIDRHEVKRYEKDMGHIQVWPFSRDGWSMWTL